MDSSSPPAPASVAPATAPQIVTPIIAQASQIQPVVVAAAAFAHLNNSYLDAAPQRNAYVSILLCDFSQFENFLMYFFS